MGGGGGGMGNAFSGAYQGATSSMPPNLQGRGWDSAQNEWYNQQTQGQFAPTQPGMTRDDFMRDARQAGSSGMARGLSGMLRQMGYEQGRGPFASMYQDTPGSYLYAGGGGQYGPNFGSPGYGYQASYQQAYNNPANYLQMGDQYGQLGSYNTLARDMASGNVGNFQFGYQGNPFTYQGGMNPQGRAGAFGRPMSAAQQYGGLGQFGGGMAGRGGMGRGMGLNYPQAGGMFGGGSPFEYVRAGGGGYYNPMGRTPGAPVTATPFGGVSNRHPLSSFLRLPGQGSGGRLAGMGQAPPGAMTTGANQEDLMRQATGGPTPAAPQFQPLAQTAPVREYAYKPGQLYDRWRGGGGAMW